MYVLGRVNVACPNINLYSLYYEPLLIQNQDILRIHGIFTTLEYSKVQGIYISVKIIVMFFGIIIIFYLTLLPRPF